MRKGIVKVKDIIAGIINQDDEGYHFMYDTTYLQLPNAQSVSLTMPLQNTAYTSKVLFPFFDGLIPEGWLLDIAEKNWKLNPRDRMGLLLSCCKDCIGAVSIHEVKTEEE
ncbi:MAG TPA: HipA N-terminal domain-containing protein [Parafilimonas sp.]|nr:HipA N-terminal domain-containing protein [Parafilimonas sp.]